MGFLCFQVPIPIPRVSSPFRSASGPPIHLSCRNRLKKTTQRCRASLAVQFAGATHMLPELASQATIACGVALVGILGAHRNGRFLKGYRGNGQLGLPRKKLESFYRRKELRRTLRVGRQWEDVECDKSYKGDGEKKPNLRLKEGEAFDDEFKAFDRMLEEASGNWKSDLLQWVRDLEEYEDRDKGKKSSR